jgi:hypothetical protein
VNSYATGLHGPTRDSSPRQLPTNHDHDGECLHLIHEYLYGVPLNSKRLLFRP